MLVGTLIQYCETNMEAESRTGTARCSVANDIVKNASIRGEAV